MAFSAHKLLKMSGKYYDPDALLFFSQLTVQPSVTYKNAYNDLIVSCKADNNWNNIHRLWIHSSELQQHARVSLKNPTSTSITEVNSPTWTTARGYTGNAANMYLNTNFNLNGNTNINSINLMVYVRTNRVAAAYTAIGALETSPNKLSRIYPRYSGDITIYSLSSAADYNAAVTQSSGLWSSCRSASNLTTLYLNGVSIGTSATASSAIPNGNIYILAQNYITTASIVEPSADQIAVSVIANGNINQLAFYNAIQTFLTKIGAQV